MRSAALAAFERKVRASVPAALERGCRAVADEARRRAGPLADGIEESRADRHGLTVSCEVSSNPVPDHAPPVVREFGGARHRPVPYMRPAASRARDLVGRELAVALRKG